MGFYEVIPGHTTAYHKDSALDEYFGKAPRAAKTSDSRWQIFKKEYTDDNWIIKWPSGSDDPKYVWDDVESYTYELLKER